MTAWRDLPKSISRAETLSTIGHEGQDRWRNPMVIDNVRGSWPKPQDANARAFDRMLGMSTDWSRKGPLK